MASKIEIFNKNQSKTNLPEIRPGDTVRVHQKITGEKGQPKIQIFEGLVLVRKHGKSISSTITVRKVLKGIGIEKIFPTHSPMIDKIEVTKRGKVRRAKLYYLRTAKGRKARLKRKDIKAEEVSVPEEGQAEELESVEKVESVEPVEASKVENNTSEAETTENNTQPEPEGQKNTQEDTEEGIDSAKNKN